MPVKTHVRVFINLFGFKYCIVGFDVPTDDMPPLIAAFAVVTSHAPEISVETAPVAA